MEARDVLDRGTMRSLGNGQNERRGPKASGRRSLARRPNEIPVAGSNSSQTATQLIPLSSGGILLPAFSEGPVFHFSTSNHFLGSNLWGAP